MAMAWYDDKQTRTHSARYKNAYAAWKEEHAAAEKGWILQTTMTAPTRIAVGKTIRNAILTAGFSLLGGKRIHKSGTVTVTYVRNLN